MSYHILLVDDDPEFREEFSECFDEYQVITAGDGQEALKKLEEPNEIDLVLLDVRLPGVKGTKILKKMKNMDSDLGVIIMTGYSSKDVAVEALRGDADEYIEKPIDIERTKQIIERMLDSREERLFSDRDGMEGKVERVKYFAKRNYNKKVGLDDAAKTVGLSPKYLSRVFKQIAGKGFNEYKLEVKLEKAKELLQNTSLNIDQIAYEIGYENPESFIRMFKKMINMTPSEFRDKL